MTILGLGLGIDARGTMERKVKNMTGKKRPMKGQPYALQFGKRGNTRQE